MDSINLDQIANILDALGQAAGSSHVQWLAMAGLVLGAVAALLHKVRATRAAVAAVEPAAVEVVKPVAEKIEDVINLDSLLKK